MLVLGSVIVLLYFGFCCAFLQGYFFFLPSLFACYIYWSRKTFPTFCSVADFTKFNLFFVCSKWRLDRELNSFLLEVTCSGFIVGCFLVAMQACFIRLWWGKLLEFLDNSWVQPRLISRGSWIIHLPHISLFAMAHIAQKVVLEEVALLVWASI